MPCVSDVCAIFGCFLRKVLCVSDVCAVIGCFLRKVPCVSNVCAIFGCFLRKVLCVRDVCAVIGCFLRKVLCVSDVCAVIGRFLRGKEKCSRLRGKRELFPPGLPGMDILRGKLVCFSAREIGLLCAREWWNDVFGVGCVFMVLHCVAVCWKNGNFGMIG